MRSRPQGQYRLSGDCGAKHSAALPSRQRSLGRAQDRTHDAVMCAAATQMALKSLLHLGLARLRVAHEQRLRGDDHPAAAIAALAGLFIDERTLQRTRLLRRTQAFDRRDTTLAGG